MTHGIARDRSKIVQEQVAKTFEREINVARHDVTSGELGEIMIEAAVMMARTAAASVAGLAGDTPTAVQLFHGSLKAIVNMVESGTEEALARALKGMGLDV